MSHRDNLLAFEKKLPELIARLQPLEERRLEVRTRIRYFILMLPLGLLMGIGSFIQPGGNGSFELDGPPHLFLLIPGILVLIAGIILWTYTFQQYKSTFKQEVIQAVIQAVHPHFDYLPEGKISKREFMYARFFTASSVDRYSDEDFVRGKWGKTDFCFSEVHVEERHTSTDSKGHTRTRYETIFKGLFMVADFHKHFQGETFVFPDFSEKMLGSWLGKKLQSRKKRGAERAELDDPVFEKEFAVYTTDQIEARYILSHSMMEDIMELKQKHNCQVYLSFLDNYAYIGLNWNRDLFEPKLKNPVTDATIIRRFYQELLLCLDIIDQLNLNTRIWSKE
jgi:hypothetical protein